MSRKEKLVKRLLDRPKDFAWDELANLLKGFGYKAVKPGRSGGSRRRFVHKTAPPITLHKPHPGNIVKTYVINDVIAVLKQEEFI